MNFKSSKILLIISSLITLLLLAVLIWSVYSIRVKNRQASELINSADRIAETTLLVGFMDSLKSNSQAELAMLDTLALSNDKIVFLIEEIEKTGQALALEVQILSVERIENKKSGEPALFHMSIETGGGWQKTFSFLNALENLPYRVMIDELDFSKSEADWYSKIVLSIPSFD